MKPLRIVATSIYERRVRRLMDERQRAQAELQVALAPEAWPVIAGTGGARKARVSLPGRGKSGGARLIYFAWTARGDLYLLDIYRKNERADLTHDDKKQIRRFLATLKAEA